MESAKIDRNWHKLVHLNTCITLNLITRPNRADDTYLNIVVQQADRYNNSKKDWRSISNDNHGSHNLEDKRH